MIKIFYMNLLKYQNETYYFVQLKNADKKRMCVNATVEVQDTLLNIALKLLISTSWHSNLHFSWSEAGLAY